MKNFKIEIKWGLLFVLAGLLWMLFEKSMGWHDALIADHAWYTNLFAFVAILIYVLALKDKKKNFYDGRMTWQQGFISGVVITAIVALFAPISQYVTATYISPEYFNNMIAYSVDNSTMSQEQAEAYFNLKSYVIQAIFGALAMGVVTSAIVAFFVKSKKI
ncbi:DUF4199 domain-containing protein [Gillisia sp. M10.2A]|uniref:DUF4199 domain-containing protein n=1 Tax=Gillisia lutea TaxID=2909668 RepID=A0ABS9EGW3_9FLAO|nr:DUF4199 domain-containing protein [Gillisia lutea]MCF4102101.1 DUF4199 domain-containing protein [Gillisia lutea]